MESVFYRVGVAVLAGVVMLSLLDLVDDVVRSRKSQAEQRPTQTVADVPVPEAEAAEAAAPDEQPAPEVAAEASAPVEQPVVETPAPTDEAVAEAAAPAEQPVAETPAPTSESVAETAAPAEQPVAEAPAPTDESVAETATPAEQPVAEQPAAAGPIVIAGLTGDPARGKKLFGQCAACHLVDETGRHKYGPNLLGMVGSDIASISGYRYSKAMAAREGAWTPEELDAYLADPRGMVKGTKMVFTGLKNAQDRADVIAFIGSKGDDR